MCIACTICYNAFSYIQNDVGAVAQTSYVAAATRPRLLQLGLSPRVAGWKSHTFKSRHDDCRNEKHRDYACEEAQERGGIHTSNVDSSLWSRVQLVAMITTMTTNSLVAVLRVRVMQNVPLEIELPWGEISTFVISPSLTLGEILAYVCAKSGLNPSKHMFDLPIANLDTLRLQQLRLSQIKMLRKG